MTADKKNGENVEFVGRQARRDRIEFGRSSRQKWAIEGTIFGIQGTVGFHVLLLIQRTGPELVFLPCLDFRRTSARTARVFYE